MGLIDIARSPSIQSSPPSPQTGSYKGRDASARRFRPSHDNATDRDFRPSHDDYTDRETRAVILHQCGSQWTDFRRSADRGSAVRQDYRARCVTPPEKNSEACLQVGFVWRPFAGKGRLRATALHVVMSLSTRMQRAALAVRAQHDDTSLKGFKASI